MDDSAYELLCFLVWPLQRQERRREGVATVRVLSPKPPRNNLYASDSRIRVRLFRFCFRVGSVLCSVVFVSSSWFFFYVLFLFVLSVRSFLLLFVLSSYACFLNFGVVFLRCTVLPVVRRGDVMRLYVCAGGGQPLRMLLDGGGGRQREAVGGREGAGCERVRHGEGVVGGVAEEKVVLRGESSCALRKKKNQVL